MWASGNQILKLSLPPPRDCISRRFESGDLELGTELQYSDADIPLSVLTAGVNIHRFSAKYRLGGGGLALWHSMLSLCLVLLTQFSVNILGKVAEKESNT